MPHNKRPDLTSSKYNIIISMTNYIIVLKRLNGIKKKLITVNFWLVTFKDIPSKNSNPEKILQYRIYFISDLLCNYFLRQQNICMYMPYTTTSGGGGDGDKRGSGR